MIVEESSRRDGLIDLLKSAHTEVTLKVALPLDKGKRRGARQEVTDISEICRLLGFSLSSTASIENLIVALNKKGIKMVGGISTERTEFKRVLKSGLPESTGPTILTLDSSACLHDAKVRSILEAERVINVSPCIPTHRLKALVEKVADNNRKWVRDRLMPKNHSWPIVPGTATCCLWRHLEIERLRFLVQSKHLNLKHLDVLCQSGDLNKAEVNRLLQGQIINVIQAQRLLGFCTS